MSRDEDDSTLGRIWDVIVVGTGIGGATLGYALAKAGRSVLFCEKGRSYLDGSEVLAGDWLETLTRGSSPAPTAEQKRRAGRFTDTIADISTGKARQLRPMLGIGTGGSSAIFGMVMERFFPEDFAPARHFPEAADSSLPDRWPVSFEEFEPYYTAAEKLYRVHSTPDPIRTRGESSGAVPPPPFSPANADLMKRFSDKGLHPYHLPMACEYVEGCRECIGFICDRNCKRDSARSCLEPAIRDHGAELLTDCDVETLEASAGRIDAVRARLRGRPLTLRAKTVVLAAGAVHTPAILLRSGGGNGLANSSGQVGRNLMRHFLDYYVVYPETSPSGGLVKQIALNDLYIADGIKFGTIQSNGRMAPTGTLAGAFREKLKARSRLLGMAFPLIRPVVVSRIEAMLRDGHVLAAFMEDLPYETNRVALADDREGVTLSYTIMPADRERLRLFRRKVASVLKPERFTLIKAAEENRVLGHVCGTCRFGDDPRTSVLDRDNRAHDLDNLYVVDGSFLPSSAGTNPSLTIAANALRVADRMAAAIA